MSSSHLLGETHAISWSSLNQVLQITTCTLQITNAQGQVQDMDFSKDVIRIGAHGKCDIVVVDETVSRFHCEIRREGIEYILVDQNSTNGTYIGSLKIKEVFLHSGCEFSIGKTKIKFAPLTQDIEVSPSETSHFGPLIGSSTEMRSVYTLISKVAPSDLSVVIQGETGTGKELVAQAS
jgi:pSer/pThr/pTyr-binding forkhead associated (FHA) protein